MKELNEHIDALNLEELPESTTRVLQLLAAMDDGGTGFRYAGVLKVPSADLDFRALASALDDAYQLLEVIVDAATYGEGV